MKKRIISTAIAAMLAVSALSTSAFAVTNFDETSNEMIYNGGTYSGTDIDATTNVTFTSGAKGSDQAATFTKKLSNGYIVTASLDADENTSAGAEAKMIEKIKAAIIAYEGYDEGTTITANTTKKSMATTGTGSESVVTFAGKLVAPTIKVTVPTNATGTANYVLNPYGLTVKFHENTNDEDKYTDAQVISQKLKYRNDSECAIGVGVKLVSAPATAAETGSTASAAKVATAPITEDDTAKSIFIYAVGGEAVADGDEVTVAETAYSEDAENILAQAKSAQKNFKTILTLDAYDEDNETNIWGAIDLQGELNTHLKAGTEWESTDVLTVTLTYQFSQVKQ